MGLPVKPDYSNDDIVNFISKVQTQENDPNVTLCFFGGEPSLEYPSIVSLIDLVKSSLKSYNLQFVLHTNGLLLNNMPSRLLGDLNIVLVSLNYEKIPKYNLAKSYFSRIIDGVEQLKNQQDIICVARLTITEKTSLYTEVLLAHNYFDYIYWQLENCIIPKDFNSFFDTYTYELKLVFTYWYRYFQKGILLKYIPFLAILKFLFYGQESYNSFVCGYSSSMIYIQTDGGCFSCSDNMESGIHKIGNVADGVHLPKYSLKSFKCKECSYISLCQGRCGRMHKEFSNERINQYCTLNQYMFNLFLNKNECLLTTLNKYPHMKDEINHWALTHTEYTP